MVLKFISSIRNGKILCSNGFRYHRVKLGYWKCSKQYCKLSIRTSGEQETDQIVVSKEFKKENAIICKNPDIEKVLEAYLEWLNDQHIDEPMTYFEFACHLAMQKMRLQVLKF